MFFDVFRICYKEKSKSMSPFIIVFFLVEVTKSITELTPKKKQVKDE
jgi:hypothetical protein